MEEAQAVLQGLPGWMELYDPSVAGSPCGREHLGVIFNFMAGGLPVMTAPNGD